MLGSTEPRLWTPPLRPLVPAVRDESGEIVVPATSVGFAQAEFARTVLRHPFDPWEEWLGIHAGELLPDGRPRFRIVLVLVARQNGKTEVLVILTLYWQFVDALPLILGTSTKLDYAKESWKKAVKLAKRVPDFAELRGPRGWTRETNGEQESWTTEDARYKIAASNEEGGRSLTVHRLVCDELRQHHDYSAWAAAEEATSAVDDAQIWALSNAGDSRSIVLNDHRDEALKFIEWWDEHGNAGMAELLLAGEVPEGMPDHRLGIFEWSALENADPTDVRALAQANPNLGRRKDPAALSAKARRAVRLGGEALTKFKTESMCISVKIMNPAVDPGAWQRCLDVGDLSAARRGVALFLDIAPDGLHATLAAAAVLPDDRVRVEIVAAWEGTMAVEGLRRELAAWLARIRPRATGWLPGGPAAALAADMRKRPGWPPRGIKFEEIRGEATAVCMGFNKEVVAGRLAHSDDPLLNAHVLGAEPLPRGDGWVFSRKGDHCDAAYAAAGAVYLARTLRPLIKPKLVVGP